MHVQGVGWTTVLIGMTDRDTGAPIVCDEADHHLPSIHGLPAALAHLFKPSSA